MKPFRTVITLAMLLMATAALGLSPASNPGHQVDPADIQNHKAGADVLLTGPFTSAIQTALTNLGVPYDVNGTSDWDTIDLASYEHVFVGCDGSSAADAEFQALAVYVSGGGSLHFFGGHNILPFNQGLNDHLVQIDLANINFLYSPTNNDFQSQDGLSYLNSGLTNGNFASGAYSARITDPAAHVLAINGTGHPVLVNKAIGNGRVDVFVYSPFDSYWTAPADAVFLETLVGNMMAGAPRAAVLGNTQTYLQNALNDLGVAFDTATSADLTGFDFSVYQDVFVGADGFNPNDASVQTLAAFAAAGGALHYIGGASGLDFTTAVNAHLMQVDLVNYLWNTNTTPPDFTAASPVKPLAFGLATPYDFVVTPATYYQLRITDPAAIVAGSNGDGFPVLATKALGAGLVNLHVNSPRFYSDPNDFAWFRQVVLNMLVQGGPMNLAVNDVPNDQGRQVRLSWDRSRFDSPNSAYLITDYAIWRRADGGTAKAYPEGTWDFVATVPARGELTYQTVVPTLCDSTDAGICLSEFFVSATTADPLTYFDSEPGSGYSVDNLAPAAPLNLNLAAGELYWDEAPEADFDYFTVYGSESPVFDPAAEVVAHTTDPQFVVLGQTYNHYYVTTTDFAGNEGEAAALQFVSNTPLPDLARNQLHANVPNPFNPQTAIKFELATVQRVSLTVFDVNGRRVRTLIQGETLGATSHERVWNGQDDSGRQAAAGVYFYLLQGEDFADTKRMVMVK
jgi:hypothetical protein